MCGFLIACPEYIVTLHNSFLNFWLEKMKNFINVKDSKMCYALYLKKKLYINKIIEIFIKL